MWPFKKKEVVPDEHQQIIANYAAYVEKLQEHVAALNYALIAARNENLKTSQDYRNVLGALLLMYGEEVVITSQMIEMVMKQSLILNIQALDSGGYKLSLGQVPKSEEELKSDEE